MIISLKIKQPKAIIKYAIRSKLYKMYFIKIICEKIVELSLAVGV